MRKRGLVLRPQAGVGVPLGPAQLESLSLALDYAPSLAVVAGRVLAGSPWPQMRGGHGPAPCSPQPTRSLCMISLLHGSNYCLRFMSLTPDAHIQPLTHFPPPLNCNRSVLTWSSSAVPDFLSQDRTPCSLWTHASSLTSLI